MRISAANLEVFKFGLYVFFPVAVLVRYGDPDWYTRHVLPYKEKMFPAEEKTVKSLPADHSELLEELAKIKARKLERKQQREQEHNQV